MSYILVLIENKLVVVYFLIILKDVVLQKMNAKYFIILENHQVYVILIIQNICRKVPQKTTKIFRIFTINSLKLARI